MERSFLRFVSPRTRLTTRRHLFSILMRLLSSTRQRNHRCTVIAARMRSSRCGKLGTMRARA
eukprot:8270309-Pyramimonas_sp.AAC.1